MSFLYFALIGLAAAPGLDPTSGPLAVAQLPSSGATAPQAAAGTDDIVVTAQRIGAPVWRVSSPTSTIIIIGSIPKVTRDVEWNPRALERVLSGADRVMYLDVTSVSASPFQAIGWFAKFRRQASLPRGQSLAAMLTPGDQARLAKLQRQGVIRKDYDSRHPLHLAREIEEKLEAGLKMAPPISATVERVVKKHKLRRVPIMTRRAKPLVDDLFRSPPQRHLPCLRAAISFAESGSQAVAERARHWAARRIPEAMSSPINEVEATCWPAGAPGLTTTGDLEETTKALLKQADVTAAVIPLRNLAGRQGLLQRLSSAGFTVSGPRWF